MTRIACLFFIPLLCLAQAQTTREAVPITEAQVRDALQQALIAAGRGDAGQHLRILDYWPRAAPSATLSFHFGPEQASFVKSGAGVFMWRGAVQVAPTHTVPMRVRVALRAVAGASEGAPAALVRRGQTVTVESRSGSLTLTLDAHSLSDGAIGRQVRLKSPISGRTFIATVAGEGRAVTGPGALK